MRSTLILRQKLEKAIGGYWDGGMKSTFDWSIDRAYPDGKSRVGSWDANYYFEVKTGKTEKETLGNARRALAARAKRAEMGCTFEYIEEN